MCFDIEWQCHITGAESQIGSSVQRMRFSAKIPPLHKGQARYLRFLLNRLFRQTEKTENRVSL